VIPVSIYVHVFVYQTSSTTKNCIEKVHSFIRSEITSVHTMSVDTSLMIFNNDWTCTILNTWSHKRLTVWYN